MSSITKLSDGTWQVRWKTPDRQSRKKNFDRKPDATRFANSVEHKKATHEYVDTMAGRVTLSEYAERWSAAQVWAPSTEVRVTGIIANHIEPVFGTEAMSSILRSEVEAWVKQLSGTMKPGTVKGVYGVLSSLCSAAVRDHLVPYNPCVDVRLPKPTKRLPVLLSAAQLDAVAAAIGEKYRPLVVLGAAAGLRVGEALGLDVSAVDFLGRQLAVTQQSVTVRRATTLRPPKTAGSVRTVPLADAVLSELAAYVTPEARGLLVADKDGGPIPQNRFSQTWARAAAKAGLPKGTRFHDLRHTFASALIAAGCSVKAVQLALGHDSAAITLNTYAHLWPSDDDRTRAAVQAFLRPDAEELGSRWGPGAVQVQ